jgi:hypothetical protein
MPPAYEILLLNTTIPQIQAAQSGDTYLCPRELAVVVNTATDAVRITQTGTGNALLVEDSANPDSTPFVVTAAGDVGIGTNSWSTSKLYVLGNTTNYAITSEAPNGYAAFNLKQTSGNTMSLGMASNGLFIYDNNAGTTRLTLDSSGNLGLGVTPSAWSGTALQVLDLSALSATPAGNTSSALTHAAFWDGTNWRYTTTNVGATRYQMTGANAGSTHSWSVAAGGTANSASVADTKSYTVVALGTTTLLQWQALFSGLGSLPSLGQVITATATGSIPNGGLVTQNISFTQAMTLDASGGLQIGRTSVIGTNNRLAIQMSGTSASSYTAASNAALAIDAGTSTNCVLNLVGGGDLGVFRTNSSNAYDVGISFGDNSNRILSFTTANTERARITSGGYFKAQGTSSYISSTGDYHEFVATLAATAMLRVENKNNTSGNSVLATFLGSNCNDTSSYHYSAITGGSDKLYIYGNGNVVNVNNSYGTLSDAKMKTDIVDASSQWSDIKAIRFRKFKMKNDPTGLVQLGVVAQELEQTSPGLVDESPDRDADGNDLGTTTKSVKTSVLLMKAAVALQEAMARIEQLEAKVASLEAK